MAFRMHANGKLQQELQRMSYSSVSKNLTVEMREKNNNKEEEEHHHATQQQHLLGNWFMMVYVS